MSLQGAATYRQNYDGNPMRPITDSVDTHLVRLIDEQATGNSKWVCQMCQAPFIRYPTPN